MSLTEMMGVDCRRCLPVFLQVVLVCPQLGNLYTVIVYQIHCFLPAPATSKRKNNLMSKG